MRCRNVDAVRSGSVKAVVRIFSSRRYAFGGALALGAVVFWRGTMREVMSDGEREQKEDDTDLIDLSVSVYPSNSSARRFPFISLAPTSGSGVAAGDGTPDSSSAHSSSMDSIASTASSTTRLGIVSSAALRFRR